jgi:hypothetical protein
VVTFKPGQIMQQRVQGLRNRNAKMKAALPATVEAAAAAKEKTQGD